jgi:hypothetical protein
MTVKNIRDLFSGEPIKNPTLRELAAEEPEHTVFEQSYQDYMSSMPGDPKHPVEDFWRAHGKAAMESLYMKARRGHERAEEEPEEEEPQVTYPYSGPRL